MAGGNKRRQRPEVEEKEREEETYVFPHVKKRTLDRLSVRTGDLPVEMDKGSTRLRLTDDGRPVWLYRNALLRERTQDRGLGRLDALPGVPRVLHHVDEGLYAQYVGDEDHLIPCCGGNLTCFDEEVAGLQPFFGCHFGFDDLRRGGVRVECERGLRGGEGAEGKETEEGGQKNGGNEAE